MKLTKNPCQIVGVRLGEFEANILAPERALLRAKFVLLRDPSRHHNQNAGRFTKDTHWSDATLEKFQEFVSALENDVMKDLFIQPPTDELLDASDEEVAALKFPENMPTLGDVDGG